MTISSHLTPQPEPRLWQLLELMRRAVDRADSRVAALTALIAVEAALVRPLALWQATVFGAGLVVGVFALMPVSRSPRWLRFLAGSSGTTGVDDCLTSEHDLANYTVGELILRLDRYLGGGVTGTPYYEDLVVQIVDLAVLARLKQRLLFALWALAAAAQAALAARLLLGGA